MHGKRRLSSSRHASARPPHRRQRGVLDLGQVAEAQHLAQRALAGGRERQRGKRGGLRVGGERGAAVGAARRGVQPRARVQHAGRYPSNAHMPHAAAPPHAGTHRQVARRRGQGGGGVVRRMVMLRHVVLGRLLGLVVGPWRRSRLQLGRRHVASRARAVVPLAALVLHVVGALGRRGDGAVCPDGERQGADTAASGAAARCVENGC